MYAVFILAFVLVANCDSRYEYFANFHTPSGLQHVLIHMLSMWVLALFVHMVVGSVGRGNGNDNGAVLRLEYEEHGPYGPYGPYETYETYEKVDKTRERMHRLERESGVLWLLTTLVVALV